MNVKSMKRLTFCNVRNILSSQSTLLVFALLAGFLCSCFCGCQKGKRIATAEVSGTITFEDQPLENARVMFVPIPSTTAEGIVKPIAFGQTDENGHYSLSMPGGAPGVVVGSHVVFVSKLEPLLLSNNKTDDTKTAKPDELAADTEPVTEAQKDEIKQRLALLPVFKETTPFTFYKDRQGEQIPAAFNTETELRFEVERKGTSEANFEVGRDW